MNLYNKTDENLEELTQGIVLKDPWRSETNEKSSKCILKKKINFIIFFLVVSRHQNIHLSYVQI